MASICVISSSLSPHSRSRVLARYSVAHLTRQGGAARLIDLNEYSLDVFPRSLNDPVVGSLVAEFQAADGWMLATPIYNWAASSALTNFLHYVLESDRCRPYLPFLLAGSAGGARSALACDGLARTLTTAIAAVQVGAPLVANSREVDPAADMIYPGFRQRFDRATDALLHFSVSAWLSPRGKIGTFFLLWSTETEGCHKRPRPRFNN